MAFTRSRVRSPSAPRWTTMGSPPACPANGGMADPPPAEIPFSSTGLLLVFPSRFLSVGISFYPMGPTQIKQVSATSLFVKWDDGHESTYTLQYLRDECPCASCKGETVLLRSYSPIKLPVMTPGKYELKSIQQVGNYAIQIYWGDGHQTGIYSWEYLHSLCRCDDCKKTKGDSP
jgi:DUF971 family protein